MADREPGSAPAADPNGQPRLFGVLPNTLFTVFSRRSRVEYAQLILDLWRTFYADPLVDQPSRKELAAFIDDRIRERKYELGDEFTGAETTAGTQMLANLVEAGWLSLYREGYHAFVEMPETIARLVRFMAELERSAAITLGGAVASMQAALEAAHLDPERRGLAVRDTAVRAEDFLNRLRSMANGMRRIEASILSEANPGRSLARFFDAFFSLVVADWHALKTTDNPYRYRGEIVGAAGRMLDDDPWILRAAIAYREQGLCANLPEAQDAVGADLERIRSALGGFERLMGHIDIVRRRIERRISITVSYLELAGEGTDLRIAALLRRLGEQGEQNLPADRLAPPSGASPPMVLVGPDGLAKPRARRTRVAAEAPKPRPHDPLLDEFASLRLAFQERIRVGNKKIAEFATRQCGPDRTSLLAEDLRIQTLEDLVTVLALPSIGLKTGREPGYAVHLLPGRFETDMMSGPAFRLESKARPAPERSTDADRS
jgi:hypothetical protein